MSGLAASTAQVAATDLLMRELFRRGKGALHQTLLANYRLADTLRRLQDPAFSVPARRVERVAMVWWVVATRLLGWRLALRLSGALWMLIGLPGLLRAAFRLHRDAFRRDGPAAASVLLLRTGVANEARIAGWIAQRENAAVQLLQRDEAAARCWPGVRLLVRLLRAHVRLCRAMLRDVESFLAAGLPCLPTRALVPTWLVLLARQAPELSWAHLWAQLHLQQGQWQALYFTMNYSLENAFRLALPGIPAAYVEHGFPRRDLPPLACQQFVYTQRHADYLRGFDPALEVAVIGLDYFAKGQVEPTRSIVVASLQDWPQYGIDLVREPLNAALAAARAAGWALVFRTRRYDTDAFSGALVGPWDAISDAASETFSECLQRVRPAMVWTSWSTAILDACAWQIRAVAFVHASLDDYFIADLDAFAYVVRDRDSLAGLQTFLRQPGVDAARLGGARP